MDDFLLCVMWCGVSALTVSMAAMVILALH
jgi:hypothetical protein